MHSAVTATFAKTVVLRKNSVANGHESITNRWNVHVHACIYATHCQSGSDSAARGCRKKFSPAPVFVCYLPACGKAEMLRVKRNIYFYLCGVQSGSSLGWYQVPLKLLLKVKPQLITTPTSQSFIRMECMGFTEHDFIRFPFILPCCTRAHREFYAMAWLRYGGKVE